MYNTAVISHHQTLALNPGAALASDDVSKDYRSSTSGTLLQEYWKDIGQRAHGVKYGVDPSRPGQQPTNPPTRKRKRTAPEKPTPVFLTAEDVDRCTVASHLRTAIQKKGGTCANKWKLAEVQARMKNLLLLEQEEKERVNQARREETQRSAGAAGGERGAEANPKGAKSPHGQAERAPDREGGAAVGQGCGDRGGWQMSYAR